MSSSKKYKAHFINFRKILFDIFKWSGWPMFLFFRVKKIYESKECKQHIKKGALIISNHIQYSDPMVLHCTFWYRRLHFVVMKEIMESKIGHWFYHNCGCIPIDREKFSLSSLREITEMLKGGYMIGIFPEGHVTLDKPMTPFKSGVVLMAYQANVPIVPVYRELRKSCWQRQRVVIGKPINIKEQYGDNLGMNQIEEITKTLFERERALKEIYQKELRK